MRTALLGVTMLLGAVPARSAMAQHPHDPNHPAAGDSSFAAMQARGKTVMGVDPDRSTLKFTSRPDGGRIELTSDVEDSAATAGIRRHFSDIIRAFAAGDFSIPSMVHAQEVPGTDVMAARAAFITYRIRELPRGAELRISTRNPAALAAIHRFLLFQRTEHHAGQ